ncbi:MAG: valine--tRNA ligase [Patescibacteria group bacterium]|nr:valine--tRNA ligase [Patescibacteria group bacterium]
MELDKAYNHATVEGKIYQKWLESGYFNPDNLPDAENREPYAIIMPPSNANAPAHVGHALGFTIQDILIRFNRMRGKKTLWLPGTDHAGFETQVVFEKKLEKEGKSRFKMQRDEFYKECWDYVQANKHITEESIRRLGASCDWSRNIFTLDPEIVKVVYRTFEMMYKDGLIYRGDRLGNWCPKHQTALSDLETKYEERQEPFYYLKYGPFIISTSRPETKFGDKYVVMHPDDKRYGQYKNGQKIELEWINGPITATVIKDKAVDMEFGTGVMTITPWHDPVDFEMAERLKLDKEQIIDHRGRLLPIAGEFAGMKILEARPKIIEKLKAKSLVDHIDENYKHNVQLCYKCGTLIEPQIIPQWFVKMTEPLKDDRPSLRDMALQALDKGEVKIVTERFEKIFRHWMENIRDWPISRQIWWGIPIPVWYKTEVGSDKEAFHFKSEVICKKLGLTDEKEFNKFSWDLKQESRWKDKNISWASFQDGIIQMYIGYVDLLKQKGILEDSWIEKNKVPRPQREAERFIGEKPPQEIGWYQDPDTFDTWFSSGQWPYATMMANDAKHGTKTLENYYPTQVMETAWDILFFWVARMIMFSYYRVGKPPFERVFLHGLVRDKDRQKMSKSKGNVIDPLGVIDTYGTDALRFALVFSTAAGNDIPLSEDKIKGMKHFGNKLWNIARFVLANIDSAAVGTGLDLSSKEGGSRPSPTTDADKEINGKLEALKISATNHLENFRLHEAAQEIYQFVWHEFADIYIEASKKQLADENLKESTQKLLLHVLINSIKLLHPFMPFITEELWSIMHEAKLLGNDPMLMVSKWPQPHK